ncbi:MAG: hypothetical protein ACHQU1_09720 [Gemmatimonadales bacterium]
MTSAPHIPGIGHEHTDVRARPIVVAGIGLTVALLLVAGLMLGLFDLLATRAARLSPPPNPLAAAEGPRLPPEPRLQVHAVRDLRELRAAESTILDHYGWVDKQAGVVRIPIARAIDLLAAGTGQAAGR